MSMHRADYIAFAEELKISNIDKQTCVKIAHILDKLYSNFNYDKFIRACQKEESK